MYMKKNKNKGSFRFFPLKIQKTLFTVYSIICYHQFAFKIYFELI